MKAIILDLAILAAWIVAPSMWTGDYNIAILLGAFAGAVALTFAGIYGLLASANQE